MHRPTLPVWKSLSVRLPVILAGLLCFSLWYVWGKLDLEMLQTKVFKLGDTLHLMWVMDTVSHGFLHGGILGSHIFYPNALDLFLSEFMPIPSSIYGMWRWVFENRIFAFNLTFLTFLVLNAVSMYWFCRSFTGRIASMVGAFIFTFSSLRIAQYGHIHLIPHFFLPLASKCLVEYEREPRKHLLFLAVVYVFPAVLLWGLSGHDLASRLSPLYFFQNVRPGFSPVFFWTPQLGVTGRPSHHSPAFTPLPKAKRGGRFFEGP